MASENLLRSAGDEATVAGPERRTYRGKNGYPVKATVAAGALRPEDVDALVIPGAFAPDYPRRLEDVLKPLREVHGAGKPAAASCHAGRALISAGLAKGGKLTGHPAIKDDLTATGASFADEAVVVGGNLIASRKPTGLPWLCDALAKALG